MPSPFSVACFPHHSVSAPCCLVFRLWKAACVPRGCILLYSHIPKVFPSGAFPSGGGTQSSVGKAPCRRNRDLHYCSSGAAELQLGGGRAQLIKSLGGRMWINVIWEMLPCDHCTASPNLLLSVELICFCSQVHLRAPQLLTSASVFPFC